MTKHEAFKASQTTANTATALFYKRLAAVLSK